MCFSLVILLHLQCITWNLVLQLITECHPIQDRLQRETTAGRVDDVGPFPLLPPRLPASRSALFEWLKWCMNDRPNSTVLCNTWLTWNLLPELPLDSLLTFRLRHGPAANPKSHDREHEEKEDGWMVRGGFERRTLLCLWISRICMESHNSVY